MKIQAPLCVACLVVTSFGAVLALRHVDAKNPPPPKKLALVGNPEKFDALYSAWKRGEARAGTQDTLDLGLNWSRAFSTERTPAHGSAFFDLASKKLDISVSGMPKDTTYDAWLVDNGPDSPASPGADDKMIRLGSLSECDGAAKLHVDLAQHDLEHFDVDLVVLTKPDLRPGESTLLVGMPNVFQRLQNRERVARQEVAGRPNTGFVLAVALAPAGGDYGGDGGYDPGYPADLIAVGEELFFHATFEGNGRTCGTCHPAENNFTIEPEFIATLPPDDPLFVAEFNPDLNFDLNGGLRFENPVLMRHFGLIAENLDGFDDLAYRFTMRSVPHTLGMSQTIRSPDAPDVVPVQRTGWSGDGAPGHGSLREFALGATKQHFTRTLHRIENVDFVFPTDAQLDALEAFQLSLGRQEELDLSTMILNDPNAMAGLIAFNSIGCEKCHNNAGANEGGFNRNFDTGVEAFGRHHPDGTGEPRPPDGGLGTNGAGHFDTVEATPEPVDPDVKSFGNKTFNTASLVEFADTVPGFHNNITNMGSLPDTVEGAVEFYRSSEFLNAADGRVITFPPNGIENIGKFLRVINALENRRSSDAYGKRAAVAIGSGSFDPVAVAHILTLAQIDCDDAIKELSDVGLHTGDAVIFFKRARKAFENAKSGSVADRLNFIDQARNNWLKNARFAMQT